MKATICWTSRDIATRIAALPAPGPLPSRAIIVPNGRVSHSLRRELLEMARPDALLGTRFLTLPMLARELLAAAGKHTQSGEESLRAMRLRLIFDDSPRLKHFPLDLLRTKWGWHTALAKTISELEEAGLQPSDLEPSGDVGRDIATLWRASDAAAEGRATWPQIMRRAAAVAATSPTAVPAYDSVLAVVTSRLSASAAALLSALPTCELAVLGARPLRQRWLERLELHFGADVASAVRTAQAPRASASDHGILRSFLFEPPEALKEPGRARASESPPQTVRLEEHAGVDEELEATAQWVVEQVAEHDTPLEEIAVLTRHRDPLLLMIRDRLQRIAIGDGSLPVFVAGGIPVTSTTAGARLLILLRSLGGYLNADHLAELLPLLRTGDEDRIAKGAALELAYSLGTVGGSLGYPKGALSWREHVPRRIEVLRRKLADIPEDPDDAAAAGYTWQRFQYERQLRQLEAVQPAILAVVALAEAVLEDTSLGTLWPALRSFVETWLVVPAGPKLEVLLDDALGVAADDASFSPLSGVHALGVIERVLTGMRESSGRYGEPAVYVGTIDGAVGLRFRATRIIGLAEGSVPSHPREDAVLPDEQRAALSDKLTTSADKSLATLHQFDSVVRFTTERLALSTPRLTLDRSYREPSPVFLEAAAALGMAPQDDPDGPLDLKDIRVGAFRPARRAAASFEDAFPVVESSWLAHASRLHTVPKHWSERDELDLDRIHQLLASTGGAMDGILPEGTPGPVLAGLTRGRPTSASALRVLLSCPHLFLYQHVLRWSEPAGPRPQRELDPMAYGSLFHNLAEAFYGQHGEAFAAKRRSPAHWKKLGSALAKEVFDEFLDEYPLAGAYVRDQQLQRLVSDFKGYLEAEWEERPKRQFIATERGFGQPKAVSLRAGDHELWVRGQIDLMEVEQGRTSVRDLKTGKASPRTGKDSDPIPTVDLQLGLYAAVTKKLAKTWRVPSDVEVSYVHINDAKGRERTFGDDYPLLAEATGIWLNTASSLLRENAYPRTPNGHDCDYCAFKPVCGEGAQARAAELLEDGEGALSLLRAIKS